MVCPSLEYYEQAVTLIGLIGPVESTPRETEAAARPTSLPLLLPEDPKDEAGPRKWLSSPLLLQRTRQRKARKSLALRLEGPLRQQHFLGLALEVPPDTPRLRR